MDGYEFSAAIFDSLVSLAWPAALVICVFLFKDNLRELLPFLTLKHNDTEVSFRLDRAEKESRQIPQVAPSPDLEPTPEEKSRFQQLAEHSPRAAILEKRAELEQTMRPIAEQRWSKANPSAPLPRKMNLTSSVRILRKQGIIDQNTSALLDDLRTIGNQAAHGSDGAELTVEDALRFGKLADRAIAYVKTLE
jgi:hypothetical protein